MIFYGFHGKYVKITIAWAGCHLPTQDDPPEGIPAASAVTVFHVIPGLLAILIPAPLTVRGPFCEVLDILINSATANDPEPQIKRLQELLVKKADIHANDDGNLRLVPKNCPPDRPTIKVIDWPLYGKIYIEIILYGLNLNLCMVN